MAGIAVMFYRLEKGFTETNRLQIEVDRQEVNIEKLLSLSNQLPTFSGETVTYLKTLPSTETDVANFASIVEQNARDSGLTISNHFDDFPKQVDVSGKNISGLGMEITVEGSFQSLTLFLTRLSSLPYYFKIDKVTILKHEINPGVKSVINGFLMMNIEKK